MTGLAGKFAHVVYGITDAQMLPTLALTAVVTIVLGMGMPTAERLYSSSRTDGVYPH
jgi:TRAP-type uncharacterized transport system fused permease subunit